MEEYFEVEFVWDNKGFRDGYDLVGSFQVDEPDWPLICITVPNGLFVTGSDSEITFLQRIPLEFFENFNAGTVHPGAGRFSLFTSLEPMDTQKFLGFFTDKPAFCEYRLLEDEEFRSFVSARDRIAEFYKDLLWFLPISETYNIFLEIAEDIWNGYVETGRPDYSSTGNVRINGAFNNWLTSITAYLSYMERQLKHRGKDHSGWNKFHQHTSEQYDKNISYRFLYEMRNFIQHQAPPLHLHFHGVMQDETKVHQLSVFCNKTELLAGWRKKPVLMQDMDIMDSTIEIIPHITSMMKSLFEILKKHAQDEFEFFTEDALLINNLIRDIPAGRDRGVYEIKFVNKKTQRLFCHMMYHDVVKAILEKDLSKIISIKEGL